MNIILLNGVRRHSPRSLLGLPTAPFTDNLDIVMSNTGPLTVQLPLNLPRMETKMIGVIGGLDLHGIRRGISWTRLSSTALAGQTLLILSQPVTWLVGDELIITTTDTNIAHTERHRIASIQNGTRIRTVSPLSFTHLVLQTTFANGRAVSVAAAVGLLTRNIRIIDPNPGVTLSGFRILVGQYQTSVFHIYSNSYFNTCYKGYLRMSNTQLIGFGVLDDSYNTDQRAGIYITGLGDYNPLRDTFIDSCSFDGGCNAASVTEENHSSLLISVLSLAELRCWGPTAFP